jgi:hypothetical protein
MTSTCQGAFLFEIGLTVDFSPRLTNDPVRQDLTLKATWDSHQLAEVRYERDRG